MILAPVLQEVAARITGTPADAMRSDPVKWAYALREALALGRPDWIVSHHDTSLEPAALAHAIDEASEIFDVSLPGLDGPRAAVTLVATLSELYPGRVVAASVTGPATTTGRLAAELGIEDPAERLDLLDGCADGLAELAAAMAGAGAERLLVWEPTDGGFDSEDLASAHGPLLRRAETIPCPTVLCAAIADPPAGYGLVATAAGSRARLISPDELSTGGSLSAVLDPLEQAGVELVLSDGPIAGDCDLALIRELGERSEITNARTGAGA